MAESQAQAIGTSDDSSPVIRSAGSWLSAIAGNTQSQADAINRM